MLILGGGGECFFTYKIRSELKEELKKIGGGERASLSPPPTLPAAVNGPSSRGPLSNDLMIDKRSFKIYFCRFSMHLVTLLHFAQFLGCLLRGVPSPPPPPWPKAPLGNIKIKVFGGAFIADRCYE